MITFVGASADYVKDRPGLFGRGGPLEYYAKQWKDAFGLAPMSGATKDDDDVIFVDDEPSADGCATAVGVACLKLCLQGRSLYSRSTLVHIYCSSSNAGPHLLPGVECLQHRGGSPRRHAAQPAAQQPPARQPAAAHPAAGQENLRPQPTSSAAARCSTNTR